MNNTCRAKHYGTGEWVYGYYAECTYYLDEATCGIIIPTTSILYPRNELEELITVDHTTACRYTGLKDKNGTKIFEHDYVRTMFGRICEVVWFSSPVYCGWDLRPVANIECDPPQSWTMWMAANLEVLGNKFDNTELMEGNDDAL